jgi:hypothetical protein
MFLDAKSSKSSIVWSPDDRLIEHLPEIRPSLTRKRGKGAIKCKWSLSCEML